MIHHKKHNPKHMKALIPLFFLLLFSCSLFAQSQMTEISYPGLAKELIKRRAADQKGRIKYMKQIKKGKRDTPKFKKFVEGLVATDKENTNRMREIVAQIGWPTFDKVGGQASNAAWIIVQHADRQPDFQAQCLLLMKEAYEAKQVTPFTYAFLYDRVQKSRGERQLYATQPIDHPLTGERSFGGIVDEANIQARRDKLDFSRTVVDYASSMNFSYTVPTVQEAAQRQETAKKVYEGFVAQARTAMQAKDFQTAADAYLNASYQTGNMTLEDRIEAARAISLSNHKNGRAGVYFLVQAILLGHESPQDLLEDEDFSTLKAERPTNWDELVAMVNRMKA
jgi:hypothetical protein